MDQRGSEPTDRFERSLQAGQVAIQVEHGVGSPTWYRREEPPQSLERYRGSRAEQRVRPARVERLYLVLVLVADRDGHSFYLHQRLCTLLETSPDAYLRARDALLRKDLIAASDTRVQVLSLPAQPVGLEASPLPRRDQIAACEALLTSLSAPDRK
jgi:hypothetical protein